MMMVAALLSLLLAPVHTLGAAGPRLLSSEYDIRLLQMGTVQHSSSLDGGGVGDGGYEVAWQSVEILAVDLVFDQPLYLTAQSGMEGAAQQQTQQPRSPHDSNHTVGSPSLDGAIALDCGRGDGGGYFVLSSDWSSKEALDEAAAAESDPTRARAQPEAAGAVADDSDNFWRSPHPSLLALYSPQNRLKSSLIQLFDDRRLAAHSTRSGSIFAPGGGGRLGGEQGALESRVGKPNVLSLMLVMATANATHSQRWLRYDSDAAAATANAPPSPLSHCAIRYAPVPSRLDALRTETQARAQLDLERRLLDSDPSSGGPHGHLLRRPVSVQDRAWSEAQVEATLELAMERMAGLTNFKGHVSRELARCTMIFASFVCARWAVVQQCWPRNSP